MIIVHAKNVANNRTATLFLIVHQPEKPYPVTIQPEKENLPTFLKKSYYDESALKKSYFNQSEFERVIGSNMFSPPKRLLDLDIKPVINQWVSDTPSEFRKKLSEAFNLGIVKCEILNLAAGNSSTANNTNEDSIVKTQVKAVGKFFKMFSTLSLNS